MFWINAYKADSGYTITVDMPILHRIAKCYLISMYQFQCSLLNNMPHLKWIGYDSVMLRLPNSFTMNFYKGVIEKVTIVPL